MLAEAGPQHLPQDLQADRGGQQHDDPVDLKTPHQAPDVAVQVGEEERGEVPDGFLGAQFPEAAAREPAAHGEGKGDPLAAHDGRDADHRAHDGAGIGAGKQASQERSGQREIGGVVVQQQPCHDPGRKRHANAGREDETFGPVPLFGQQDPAEPGKTDEHRRHHGHHGQFHDERGEQVLLGRQKLRVVRHDA